MQIPMLHRAASERRRPAGSYIGLRSRELVAPQRVKRGIVARLGVMTAVALVASLGSGSVPALATTSGHLAQAVNGGTATAVEVTAFTSLDPQWGTDTPALEGMWLAYTPLLTFAHENGVAGTKLIPGLAKALPTVSSNGLTYVLTLRSGLQFSNGRAVVASDFTFAIERLLDLRSGLSSYYLTTIQGAETFFKGTKKTISGIATNNVTGMIKIHLIAPDGAFEDVLALPMAAPVPPTTPMKVLVSPPPGVGPYVIEDVVPTQSFELVKSPNFASFHIPGIPTGHLDTIKVTIEADATTAAEEVIDNSVDDFDPLSTVPASLITTIKSEDAKRFTYVPAETTDYIWMNQSRAPFNNELAREAVALAVNREDLVRLASGALTPGCYIIPPGIVGHPSAPCPYQPKAGSTNLAKAKELVKQAHLVGSPVTVWGETTSPVEQFVEYYGSVLKELGFKVSFKLLSSSTYGPSIGSKANDPQTGYSAWSETYPDPINFYTIADATSIEPVGNKNRSYIDDPHIQSVLAKVSGVPAGKLTTVASEWVALTEYVAKKVDEFVIGYPDYPKFMSDRLDFEKAVINPIFGNDWSTWELLKG